MSLSLFNYAISSSFSVSAGNIYTSSIVSITGVTSGSITFTPAFPSFNNYASASLLWLSGSINRGPFYNVSGGYFTDINPQAFSSSFNFSNSTTLVTQSNSSFYFDSSSIVGYPDSQFQITYLTGSAEANQTLVVDRVVDFYIDTGSGENAVSFKNLVYNPSTQDYDFQTYTSIKGGIETTAKGTGSFAVGTSSLAQGNASVAEGIGTLATGLASHAAGINTTASGVAAFSMGIETDADGTASFAAGSGSLAKGDSSVAMGIGTIASASGQVTIGHFNFPLNSPDHLFVVGGGTGSATSARGNLLEVYGGIGSTYKAVKIDVGSTFTQTSSPPQGFSIYGNTVFNGDITGSGNIQLNDDSLNFNATSSFIILDTDGLGPDFNKLVINRFGINFDKSNKSTSPGSKYLWTDSSNRLFYGSNAIILNDGNTLGATMTIGTTDANNLQLETNNTTRVFISSSGNVGIGTTAPLAELHISGANNDSLLRIQSPASASILFVTGSGNVGLGTLTPTATLEIASTGSATLGQAQIYLNTTAVGRNRIDFNTVGLGVPATTTRSDGTKITLYPAISATQTDIALGVAFPAGVGEFWSSVYASTISFSWYAAATQIMRLVGDGQLRLGAGTAALPVISAGLSGTDTNTGIYFPTADTIGLVTGGTERARITSAGSASIGTITSTPSATLHVSGANNVTLLRVASPGSADALVVSGSGNVGIGTATPTGILHISGSGANTFLRLQNPATTIMQAAGGATNSGSVVFFGTSPTAGYDLDVQGTGTANGGSVRIAGNGTIWNFASTSTVSRTSTGNTSIFDVSMTGTSATVIQNPMSVTFNATQNPTSGSGYIVLRLNATHATTAGTGSKLLQSWEFGGTRLSVMDLSGSLGIGTGSAPPAKLFISGANAQSLLQIASPSSSSILSVSGSGYIGIGIASPAARLHISGASANGLFEIDSPAVNNIIYVSGSGNVGIGTNLPSADLHISGASADSLLRVGSPTDSNILFITGSGRVGIGTTTPDSKLHVSSNGGYQLRVAASASFSSSLMVSGSFGYVGIGVESPQSILHVNDRPEFNNVTGNVPVAFIGNYQNITTFYNNNSQDNTVLGEPAAWMNIKCDGAEYLIPLYTS